MASAQKHEAPPQQKTRQVKTFELVDQAVSPRSQITMKRVMQSISSALL